MIAFVFHFLDHLLCLSEIKLVYVLEENRIKREFVKITNGNDEMYTLKNALKRKCDQYVFLMN